MASFSRDKYELHSLSRAFELLHCFSPAHPEWGVSELADALQMQKSAVHRVLVTFVSHQFIKQNDNRRYSLGPKIVQLSNVYRSGVTLIDLAKPELEQLAARTGKTCHLARLHEDEVIYLASIRPKQAVPLTVAPAVCGPCYCTALGKVLLAYQSAEELERIVEKIRFVKRTPNTIVGANRLKAHLKEVQTQGYAIDHEESIPNLRCISAPIHDASGKVEAAISLAGHIRDINHEILLAYVERVRAAAERISRRIA